VITDPVTGIKLPFLPSPIPPFSEKVAPTFVQKYVDEPPPSAGGEGENEDDGKQVFGGSGFKERVYVYS